MPRVSKGAASRQAKKRVMKATSGFHGAPGRQFRLSKEGMIKAGVNARIGRKQKKRHYRALWITRLSAACQMRGIRYSQFIDGCKKANIELNRKMLSEIAIYDSAAFDALVDQAKAAIA